MGCWSGRPVLPTKQELIGAEAREHGACYERWLEVERTGCGRGPGQRSKCLPLP
jgi:hypothetical protein